VVTRRMRRRHGLLDAYIRLEFEERRACPDDLLDPLRAEPPHTLSQTPEGRVDDDEAARKERPA
jgi:hypothetical protein